MNNGKVGAPKVYNMGHYNESKKMEYLNSIKGKVSSKNTYSRQLNNIGSFEWKLGVELGEFSKEQYDLLLRTLVQTNRNSFDSYATLIRNYRIWYTGLSDANEIIDEIVGNIYNELIPLRNEIEQTYLRDIEELKILTDMCKNKQDAICYILPFYGLSSETILELKEEDITEGKIKIMNRTISIEPELYKYIEMANEETIYKKNNIKDISTMKSAENNLEPKNGRIFRSIIRESTKDRNTKIARITHRIKSSFKDIKSRGYVTNVKTLTASSILYSGLFYSLYQVEKENKLIPKEFTRICNNYGMSGDSFTNQRRKYEAWKEAYGYECFEAKRLEEKNVGISGEYKSSMQKESKEELDQSENKEIENNHNKFSERRKRLMTSEDFEKINREKKEIGDLGELWIYEQELKKLKGTPFFKKIDPLKSLIPKDGYDILSYELDGTPIYIEVKTERGFDKEFFITETEKANCEKFLKEGRRYLIYRVHNIYAEDENEITYDIIENPFTNPLYKNRPVTWKFTKIEK